MDNAADIDPVEVLKQMVAALNWDELSALYLSGSGEQAWGQFDAESLMRATVKYGGAVQHVIAMFRR